jgi:hydrogenase nickel incorporation protein HypA/HybF
MHELSVCLSLLDQVERIAREHGADGVERILLRIGPLSGVEAPLLRNAYPLAAAGSVAEHARLDIETAPVRVRCSACGAETDAAPNRLVCGQCGDWHTRLISGAEMLLASLELRLPDAGAADDDDAESGQSANPQRRSGSSPPDPE